MPLRVLTLRTESLDRPLGLDEPTPRFTWTLGSDVRGDVQSAYHVIVSTGPEPSGDVWDSGEVASGRTVHVAYEGPALRPLTRYWWTVRARDAGGRWSAWAEPTWWESGLLYTEGPAGSWIGAPAEVRATPEAWPVEIPHETRGGGGLRLDWRGTRPSWMRRAFTLATAPRRARLLVTARGLYEATVNGRRVGQDLLTPGWTDYRHRIEYRAYDVTDLLRAGENVIGALVADGWYCGRVAWTGAVYGQHPSLLAELRVELDGGEEVVVTTDDRWRCAPSALVRADLLEGQIRDLSEERPGWDAPGFDASRWAAVETVDAPAARIVGAGGPPVRVLDELPALEVVETSPGTFRVDFGQNMVGWVRLRVTGAAGRVVRIRHAEMLQPDGDLYTENLRGALAMDFWLVDSDDAVVLEPSMTFHGFRYAEVSGLAPGHAPQDVTGVVVGSDTPWTGAFACSSDLVTKLQRNVEWGQRGNFVDVPTDCPQRDERLGWMGDAQVFAPTACWNADVSGFLSRWLEDVWTGGAGGGALPIYAPWVDPLGTSVSPAWSDAGVIVPWTLYERYGDVRVLERSFDAMARWVDWVAERNPDGLWTREIGLAFGDWLAVGSDTPAEVIATAYFARSADLVARAAGAIGRDADARRYGELASLVRRAFRDAFLSPGKRIVGSTQTSYVLAIAFGLLDPAELEAAGEHLAAEIAGFKGVAHPFRAGHLSTGFLGVGHLLPALEAVGRLDLAYRLLESDDFPSWGFSIRHGATTIWERWDGWTPERGFQTSQMNSFNHYSLGSCGDWLFQAVAGIRPDPDHPGFERFAVRPRPGGSLTWARASYDSVRGRIASAWEIADATFRLEVIVPTGATAAVWIPDARVEDVTEDGRPVPEAPGVRVVGDRGGFAVVEVGGGTYRFAAPTL